MKKGYKSHLDNDFFSKKPGFTDFITLLKVRLKKIYLEFQNVKSSLYQASTPCLAAQLNHELIGAAKCFLDDHPLFIKSLLATNDDELLGLLQISPDSKYGMQVKKWLSDDFLEQALWPKPESSAVISLDNTTLTAYLRSDNTIESALEEINSLLKQNNGWRLFIGKNLQLQECLSHYEHRQPGATKAMANAFSYAIHTLPEDLSLLHLLEIHRLCKKNVKGLNECIKLHQALPYRTLELDLDVDTTFGFGLSAIGHAKNATPTGYRELCLAKHAGIDYWVEKGRIHTTLFGNMLNKRLNECIDEYHQVISEAKTPKEKLMAIIAFISHLERIHPFFDTNCRTLCVILFQRELLKHGFKIAILDNPNHFDGFSVDEMVTQVQLGFKSAEECKTKEFYPQEVHIKGRFMKENMDLIASINHALLPLIDTLSMTTASEKLTPLF